MDVDILAVGIMEALGIVSFFTVLLLWRQLRKIREKQRAFEDALKRALISDRGDGKCYSYNWVMDHVVHKPRKLLNATPFLLATFSLLLTLFSFLLLPRLLSNIATLGYASVIALIGLSILLATDVFEAYGYTKAIYKVPIEQLDREDRSFIELAREGLEKGTIRFFALGVAFALVGPFIPEIFDGLVYALVLYTHAYFGATEAFVQISQAFGLILILFLPAIILFLPELLGRIILHHGKSLARRLLKRKRD